MQKKKEELKHNSNKIEENITTKGNQSLVFISHDSRDAELAEAFSKLLSSVSAGVLKTFRSSDPKGSEGIEYGVEWYPEIMKNLDNASNIVCLLTKNSIDRPWILYEAGVAKGKLNTILGIAIGIPLAKANNGPFAQFQNCTNDADSLTKLVVQLVKTIPNADPDKDIVKQQVEDFIKKSKVIQSKSPDIKVKKEVEIVEDASVAKLFEEVKLMFKDLPYKIENKIDPEFRRRKRFHPMMLEEIMHIGMKFGNNSFGFLMMISLFKDDFPWIYEIGLETYRGLKTAKTPTDKHKIISNFKESLDMLEHPMIMEYFGKSEEMIMFIQNLRHTLPNYFERYLNFDKE